MELSRGALIFTYSALNFVDLLWMCHSEYAESDPLDFIGKPNITCGRFRRLCNDLTCSDLASNCDGKGGRYCKLAGQRYCIHDGCQYRHPQLGFCEEDYCSRCPDGSCSRDGVTCPGVCPMLSAAWCNGECVLGGRCQPECPQYSCDNGQRCYTDAQKCTGRTHCIDGTDEIDCNHSLPQDSSFSEWLTFYVVCILIILVTVVSICAALIRRRRHPTYLSSDGDCDFIDDGVQVVDFTGTRLQPAGAVPHAVGTQLIGAAAPLTMVQPTSPPSYSEATDASKYSAPPLLMGSSINGSDIPSEPPPPYEE